MIPRTTNLDPTVPLPARAPRQGFLTPIYPVPRVRVISHRIPATFPSIAPVVRLGHNGRPGVSSCSAKRRARTHAACSFSARLMETPWKHRGDTSEHRLLHGQPTPRDAASETKKEDTERGVQESLLRLVPSRAHLYYETPGLSSILCLLLRRMVTAAPLSACTLLLPLFFHIPRDDLGHLRGSCARVRSRLFFSTFLYPVPWTTVLDIDSPFLSLFSPFRLDETTRIERRDKRSRVDQTFLIRHRGKNW